MHSLYVQYGCGFCAPKTWLNFDASPTLRFERIPVLGRLYTRNAKRFPENVLYGDIVRGLPITPGSCNGIYCSHVLEHLALEDCDAALSNTYLYLRKEGTFRLVVPDLEFLARNYLAQVSETASLGFMEQSSLGQMKRPRGLYGFIKDWLGNSRHLWMWDQRSMMARLREHGFKDIRLAAFSDAEDPRFTEVEEKDRFAGSLALQCHK
jgi:predicted SAM-dependent methyltransferase